MSKQLVFIDDSGDPGFKAGASSSTFVMASAIFIDSESAQLVDDAISQYRRSLGWKDSHEFKFRTTAKPIKLEFLRIVNQYNFDIYAVYVDKAKYPNMFKLAANDKLYNWSTKELLAIMPLEDAAIRMDGKYTRQYKLRVKTYIRRELNSGENKKVADFDTSDSRRDNLIQLTDIIVGSINRSLQKEKTDSDEYINIIRKKIVELKSLDLM
ncbi:DUF3800 domain-containing protein [Candidatus Saccharibacteria bacterium]|nr:DUF3800 domain-containing protein [Candidatus Saccharibacteria bacterium]